MSLSEAASLLPSFLLPPETDLSALPAAIDGAHYEDAVLVGGAAWGHGGVAEPSAASRHHPLSLAPCAYGRAESNYQLWATPGEGVGSAYAPGGLSKFNATDDARAVSDAMGWLYPHDVHAHTQTHAHAQKGSDDSFGQWGIASTSDTIWGGSRGDTSRRWGSMGTGLGLGSSNDDACELEVIAAARSLKQLLAMPYSDQRVSLAVHRVGETLLIDQPPPASQSWGAASAPDRGGSGVGQGMSSQPPPAAPSSFLNHQDRKPYVRSTTVDEPQATPAHAPRAQEAAGMCVYKGQEQLALCPLDVSSVSFRSTCLLT